MKGWFEDHDIEIVTVGIAIMIIGLILMAFTGCAAPVATQLPKAEAEATGAFNRAETTMDTISTQPSGVASAGAPVRADKTGDVNVGAGSGGAWPIATVFGFTIAAFFITAYMIVSKLLAGVTGAVQALPPALVEAVKKEVKEHLGIIGQWLLTLFVKSKGTEA